MNNMQQFMAQAKKLQDKIETTKNELKNKEVSGSAGSDAVTVTMTLNGDVKSITIKEDVINPKEREMLEDLIITAINNAKNKATQMYDSEMEKAIGYPGGGKLF
jgi:DNA-binding YbaB/EbfC family protein